MADILNGTAMTPGTSDGASFIGLVIVVPATPHAVARLIQALQAGSCRLTGPDTHVDRTRPVESTPTRSVHKGWADLTERERAVAELASRALTNRQIARRLFISPSTVNYHLRHVYQRLGIRSRIELVSRVPSRPDADRQASERVAG